MASSEAHKAANRRFYAKNRDKVRAQSKAYRKRNPDSHMNTSLKTNYGITIEDKRQMYAAQDGKCGACGKPIAFYAESFVDHDHSTGKVRGLLCGKCNSALGFLDDSSEKVIGLLHYLGF